LDLKFPKEKPEFKRGKIGRYFSAIGLEMLTIQNLTMEKCLVESAKAFLMHLSQITQISSLSNHFMLYSIPNSFVEKKIPIPISFFDYLLAK